MSQMNILDGNGTMSYNNGRTTKSFTIENMNEVLAANALFPKNSIQWYTKFNRYGFIDPYKHENVLKEFLFFTRPDLNIFADQNGTLAAGLKNIPFFQDAKNRHTNSLWQLQSTNVPASRSGPFMNILTNTVASKLDLPEINSESQNTTSNIMGIEISLRGHSLKSDNGYDFTLSFTDSAYLEVYMMAKAYDEYMRRIKTGEASPFNKYIVDNIISDQFSVYKFLIGQDGETIMYYAKLTGVYFTGVPRSDFGDPTDFGKYSLSFHAQFVEDNNPLILQEFNRVVLNSLSNKSYNITNTWNGKIGAMANEWVSYPIIAAYNDERARRRAPLGAYNYRDYRLKWIK